MSDSNSGFESLFEGADQAAVAVEATVNCDCYDCVCECDYNDDPA